MHVRVETTQCVDICMYICTNHKLSIPQTKNAKNEFETNWASGFNLSLKELLFDGWMDV